LGSNDYCTQVVTSLAAIEPDAWDALVARENAGPFLRHTFLHALEASGSVGGDSGWTPQLLVIRQGDALVAAAPLYAKEHSYGEYVFDWAWAEAYQRYGMQYYPKGLVAVPFTPVGGARLLARDAPARHALADALLGHARAQGWSSLHVLFARDHEMEALLARGLLARQGVQFHWHNRPGGYASFDDFLAALAQPKRKKIRAERRKVHDAGVSLVRKVGHEITAADWAHFHRCYCATYAAHWSTPYLNLDFFQRIGAALPEHLMLVVAEQHGAPIAASLGVFDTAGPSPRLYGRYWGALRAVDCLHFEACYYQMIDFAIERGLAVFEGGAQGAHKLARGLDPVPTRSAHWIADPQMRAAIARFVERESDGIEHTIEELNEHRAFREGRASGVGRREQEEP
jgi:predicted N-acyltransferase